MYTTVAVQCNIYMQCVAILFSDLCQIYVLFVTWLLTVTLYVAHTCVYMFHITLQIFGMYSIYAQFGGYILFPAHIW